MSDEILVPLDGSGRAESVLPIAVGVARAEGCSLLLVHALLSSRGAEAPSGEFLARERKQAAAYLGRMRTRVRRLGVEARTKTLEGEASAVVLRTALREHAGLIVLSGRGHGGGKGPLGSVAERIIRRSTVPVLLFRGRRRSIRTLLIPVEIPRPLVATAGQLARAFKSGALLVQGGRREVPSSRLARDVLTRLGVRHRGIAGPPSPARDLEKTARALDADLVVVAGKSTGPALGRVAERLLLDTDLSLLLHRVAGK